MWEAKIVLIVAVTLAGFGSQHTDGAFVRRCCQVAGGACSLRRAAERAAASGLADVAGKDVFHVLEVGDGLRDLQYLVAGAG